MGGLTRINLQDRLATRWQTVQSSQRTTTEAVMACPDFIAGLPGIAAPLPEDVVLTSAVRSDDTLVVLFTFRKDMTLLLHAHGAQWGGVIAGKIAVSIGCETRTHRPGDSSYFPPGVEHGAAIKTGSRVIDLFREADRSALMR